MSISPLSVETSVLDRLLDPGDPALRTRVLADLLGRPKDDPDLLDARGRIPEQPWISTTLKATNPGGGWGPNLTKGYRGTIWALYHLSELGAPSTLGPIEEGVSLVLGEAKAVRQIRGRRAEMFDGNPDGVFWEFPTACFTARAATALVRFGQLSHPVTRGALASCEALFHPEEGFRCFVMDDSLLPACFMAVPAVLKVLLAVPPLQRSPQQERRIGELARLLKKRRLFRYVAKDRRAWREWADTVSAAERREESPKWLAAGRAEPREEKAGWLRFSFPHGYNSDLLEVLLLLGEAGVERDETICEGLELVLSKKCRDGMWEMVGGLNGKMHAKLDRKGASSPWITYRALLAFKRFGLFSANG